MKSLGPDPWPPGSTKSPIFWNFEVNLKNYIRNLKSGIIGKSFSNQILEEQGKVQLLLENLYHFSHFFSHRSGIRSGF
jgi:hypothetical protein